MMLRRSVLVFTLPLLVLVYAAPATGQGVRVGTLPSLSDTHMTIARAPSGELAAASWREDGVVSVAGSGDFGATWVLKTPIPGPVGPFFPFVLAVQDPMLLDTIQLADSAFDFSHRRSTDGGLTWSGEHLLPAPIFMGQSRPMDLGASTDGVLAIALIHGPPSGLGIHVSRDGGETFAAPVLLGSPGADRPKVRWQTSDDVLVCWQEGTLALCSRSTDRGVSFRPALVVSAIAGPAGFDVALRPPDEVLLAHGAADRLEIFRSLDGGDTWPARASLAADPGDVYGAASISVDDAGRAWVAVSSLLEGAALWSSPDAIAWTVSSVADGATCGAEEPIVVAGAADVVLYRDGRATWRSGDGGASWTEPEEIVPSLETTDMDLLSLGFNVQCAFWTDRGAPFRRLMASRSDDWGATWSTPRPVSDRALADAAEVVTPAMNEIARDRFAAVALRSGGVVAVWLHAGSGGCAEVRASRSRDGMTFDPSVAVGNSSGFPVTIAEDAAGVVVAIWLDAGEVYAARSTDGGASWSVPSLVLAPDSGEALVASTLALAPDGSLGLAVSHLRVAPEVSELVYHGTADGGLTWWTTTITTGVSTARPPVLVASGSTLVSFLASGTTAYRSGDSGANWLGPNTLAPEGDIRATGDDLGNVWYTNSTATSIDVMRPGQIWRPHAPLPSGSDVRTALLRLRLGGEQLGVLFADHNRTPPGVFYVRSPCTPPVIVTQPIGYGVCGGDLVSLSVTTSPEPGLTFQWYKNGLALPGATGAGWSEVITDPPGTNHVYEVAVINRCDAVQSASTTVHVDEQPVITADPADVRVCEGRPFSLGVGATGATSWQWSKDAMAVPGATLAFHGSASARPADAGLYACTVASACGSASSATARVEIDPLVPPLANPLFVRRDGAELVFTWADAPITNSYDLVSDVDPAGPYATLTATSPTGDPGPRVPLPSADLVFYRVTGVNACGRGHL